MQVELPHQQPYVSIPHLDSLFGTDHNAVKAFVNKFFDKEAKTDEVANNTNISSLNNRGGAEEENTSSKHSMESEEVHSKSSNASFSNLNPTTAINTTTTTKTSSSKSKKNSSTKTRDKEKKKTRCTLM
jgi:hypothetical protein